MVLLTASAANRFINPLCFLIPCFSLGGVSFLLVITRPCLHPPARRLAGRRPVSIRRTFFGCREQNGTKKASVSESPSETPLSRNMVNTFLLAAMIAFVLPALYLLWWAPDLAAQKIETTVETFVCDTTILSLSYASDTSQESLFFPSIALLKDPNWSSQAELSLEKSPKCFQGLWEDNLPVCSRDHPGDACNCANDWVLPLNTTFTWRNTTYHMLQLQPTESAVSKELGQALMVQAFFSYDTEKALKDRGSLLEPSLRLAIWDPHLTLAEALERGLTRLVLINANALTSLNLYVESRQTSPGSSLALDYARSDISSIPSRSLLCDTGNNKEQYRDLCEVTLHLQYVTFDLVVSSYRRVMEWPDMVAVAGSWISLFQILAWILSGLAMR
ncbi:hypothetical protein LY76DRAFT_528814 [Colletotrichum caudatum]|nr:hypothetical protein LY76DRAFT_528814 [Colletotrichum caudatum]